MKWMMALLTVFSISSAFARADVSLRNGNFFVTLRDISYPGGLEPKIERVYNSKSEYNGMFGYSWGSAYEVQISPEADGSLIITEFGGGSSIRFTPKGGGEKDLENGIDSIIEGAKRAGIVSGAKSSEEFRLKVANDAAFRARQFSFLVGKGFLQKKAVAVGTQFTSTQFQYQYVTRAKGGYVRVLESGAVQTFNEAGKIAQIMDRNKNFINFSYDRNNRLIQLVDNQNRKMNFTYNQFGLVEKIAGESGKAATYRYSKEGALIFSKDDNGVENTFKYTTDQFRNLSEIGYPNQRDEKGQSKKMSITYYGMEKNGSVKSVTNPDGTSNEYEYLSDLNSKTYYAVRVVQKESNGTKMSDSKYEYHNKAKPSGEQFTLRMVTTVDGVASETVYDERLGFPTKITSGGRTTQMDYDQKGRMVKKVTPYETTELAYDAQSGKVSRVVKKLNSGSVRWSEFQYDPATKNLVFAKNSDKKTVKLVYDSMGRVRALMDESNHALSFKYNELSKPVEISDPKMGTVKFTYKNSGEVDRFDSNGGANVAAEMMRVLQTLIDITAPAGVTMSI